jgi:hypothetical protein
MTRSTSRSGANRSRSLHAYGVTDGEGKGRGLIEGASSLASRGQARKGKKKTPICKQS